MRWSSLMTLTLVLVAGCGRGYQDDNRAIVADLPEIDGTKLVGEDYYDSCSGDTCLFGNDRSGARLTYSVDIERFTQQSLVDGYVGALDGWSSTIDEGCLNADPSFCEEIVFASFANGDARIDLNLDNWVAGTFDLHVDARGGS